MACDGVGKQEIFFLRSGADIMNDQRRAFLRFPVGNDANVGNTIGQVPCNQVAGLVVRRVFRNGNGPTFSGKKVRRLGTLRWSMLRSVVFNPHILGYLEKWAFMSSCTAF